LVTGELRALYIFNFNDLVMNLFNNIPSTSRLYICLTIFCVLIVITIFYRLIVTKNTCRQQLILAGIAIFIAIDVAFFFNPLFFFYANRFLKAKDIGYRQAAALRTEIYRFKKESPSPFLAVGSSQTGVIWGAYAQTHQNLSILKLAGMEPLDFLLYKDIIASRCKQVIILTISDFDIGRMPMMSGAKLSPPQGISLFSISRLLLEYNLPADQIADFMIANICAPYRYQYIFKGILNKVLDKSRAFPHDSEVLKSHKEVLEKQFSSLARLSAKWFPVNLSLLNHFIEWADEQRLTVVIAQGHYYPDAEKKNKLLPSLARKAIKKICNNYDNCHYYPSSKLYNFSTKDYVDAYHIKLQAGLVFSKKFVKIINSSVLASNHPAFP